MDDIEALSEKLGSLQITNKASEEYKQSNTEMSTALAPAPMMNNGQATMPKSMVLDPGWFVLWQPLITKTNDYTSGKSLKLDIKWEVHKRTQQEVSAKLESYIY